MVERVHAVIKDESTMDYELGEEFTDPHSLAEGQCCGHFHARQPVEEVDVVNSQQVGIEPVEKLFNIYTEHITRLIGQYRLHTHVKC